MKLLLTRLGVGRSLFILASFLLVLLLLLLLVGWVWASRLPPAPTILPDPQILVPATITVPHREFDPAQLAVVGSRVDSDSSVLTGTDSTLATGLDQELKQELGSELGRESDEESGQALAQEKTAVEGQHEEGSNHFPESYSLTARPLFWSSRRPVLESDTAKTSDRIERPKKDDFDKVKIIGIYYAGENSGVIAEVKGKRQRVRLKQPLEGWTLDSISADGVIFIQDNQSKKLQLEHANSSQYTATAASKLEPNEAVKKDESSPSR